LYELHGRCRQIHLPVLKYGTPIDVPRPTFTRSSGSDDNNKRKMTTPGKPANEKTEATPSAQHTLLAANHEIRSAMHSLAGMLALLGESGLNTAQREYAASASDSARALFGLIERITDLSLIESGALRAAPAPFDLAQEMRAVCIEKIAAARERGSALEIHPPPSTLLQGDVRWISNLFADLLDWAETLSPNGSARLHTELAQKEANNCHIPTSRII
jgi:K+-sensing histidine kinase KdpD